METRIIETSGNGGNWGKFMVARFTTDEWARRSALPDGHGDHEGAFLRLRWSAEHLWVLDLETGEGAMFRHGGLAEADLNKRRIWVCPMFVGFLAWLYEQDVSDLQALPAYVDLPHVPFALSSPRRPGSGGATR